MKLTDEQVSDLPISHARAELLEDILRSDSTAGGTSRGWRMPVLAAAASAVLIAGGLGIASSTGDPSDRDGAPATSDSPSDGSSVQVPVPTTDWVWWTPDVTWAVREVAARSATDLRITYEGPHGESLELRAYPGNAQGLPRPDGRGLQTADGSRVEEVELLDGRAKVWQIPSTTSTCSDSDCATYFARVRRPATGSHLVVRLDPGDRPVSAARFLEILDGVAGLDAGEFADSVPSETVTPDEKREALEAALVEVPLPPGFTYQTLMYAVPGTLSPWLVSESALQEVVCGWQTEFQRGRRTSALDALDGATDWPAIKELAATSPAEAAKLTDAADQLRDPANDGDSGLDCY